MAEAVDSARTLLYPLCLLPFDVLKQAGQLRSHEELRAKLVFVDLYEDLIPFSRAHPSLFFSHQWLGHSTPDPTGVHFRAMVAAGTALCEEFNIDEAELLIWVDYCSIPQKNRNLQRMAISSLGVYAASCRYFIAVTPPASHADAKDERGEARLCDLRSYTRRGWCRLENLAFMTLGMRSAMYLYGTATSGADEAVPRLHSLMDWEEEHLLELVHVFEGDFTMESDKATLAPVLLGLYSLAVQSKMASTKEGGGEGGGEGGSGDTAVGPPSGAPATGEEDAKASTMRDKVGR